MKRTRRGVYRGVYSALIDDPDYQRLTPNARLVLLTLRLCSQAGAAAIFRAYGAVVAEQTGLSVDAVEASLHELETSPSAERPWIVRDAGIVWVRNALRYDPHMGVSDPKHRAAIERVLAALPRSGIVSKFCRYYGIVSPFGRPPKAHERAIEESPMTPRGVNSSETEYRVPSTEKETERGVRAPSPSANGRAHVVPFDAVREVDL
jgi:hypothetical protein